jgi:hypothetical protein
VIEEHHELSLRDRQIRVTELVGNVPSERSELSSLEDQSVEEAKTPHESFISLRLVAGLELVGIHTKVRSVDVVLQSLRRLDCCLDTILKDSDRELLGGHGSKPDSESAVRILNDFFDHTIESRHE